MKTALICHKGDHLNSDVLARWLASFSDLVCVVLIDEPKSVVFRRIRAERRRVGLLRLLDVLAFKVFYKLLLADGDRAWELDYTRRLAAKFPPVDSGVAVLEVPNPNSEQVSRLLAQYAPDVVIARCKWLLKKSVYSVPVRGTYVMHPGYCPEYRNSHGCFWALARRDLAKVGMTLLKIDDGIDTGPIYARHSYDFDEIRESHIRIQHRVVFDNLDELQRDLSAIADGVLQPVKSDGAFSANWGQPWLTAYLRWKSAASKPSKESSAAL